MAKILKAGRWAALMSGFFLLSSGCASGVQSGARHASDSWIELGTPHFRIATDLPEPRARELAGSLEDMRAALLALAWPNAREPPRGYTNVILFSKPADFDRASGLRAMTAGIAVSRSGQERLLSFSPGPDGGIPRVAVHELAHDLSHWFMPLQPAWFAEGLAVYLEGTRLDRESGRAVMGDLSAQSLEWLKHTKVLMRSSKLFAGQGYHSSDAREGASFYAASWFLVHYLLNREGEPFGRFQQRMVQRAPWRSAWQESFPKLTPNDLDQNLLAYAADGRFSEVEVEVELPPFEPSRRPLSAAEVLGLRALLGSTLGRPSAGVEAEEALKLDPNELNALRVRYDAAASDEARLAIAAHAVRAHPNSAEAYLLRAWASPAGESRTMALDTASRLAPDHPGVAWLLAERELQSNAPGAALKHVRFAVRSSTPSPRMLGLELTALTALGRCDEAQRILGGAVEWFADDCQMTVPGSAAPLACAQYLRQAFDAARVNCREPAAARAGTPG